MNVYVASSCGNVAAVVAVHEELRVLGFTPTSTWVSYAEAGNGRERLDQMPPGAIELVIRENDAAIDRADVVIVLAHPAGKETYAEARYAWSIGRKVLWVGEPRPLTAYRSGVERFSDCATAIAWLRAYAAPARSRDRRRPTLAEPSRR